MPVCCRVCLWGVATGSFVSVVIALIGYFHEREVLIAQAANTSQGTYINLSVLERLIRHTLLNIGHTATLQNLPFRNITAIAQRISENYNDIAGELFAPFNKGGSLTQHYYDFASYRPELQNIALLAQSIEALALQIEAAVLQTNQAQNAGCLPAVPVSLLSEYEKALLVKISKFHEHVTDRTMQYETITQYFCDRAYGKDSWNNARITIDSEVDEIISNYVLDNQNIS